MKKTKRPSKSGGKSAAPTKSGAKARAGGSKSGGGTKSKATIPAAGRQARRIPVRGARPAGTAKAARASAGGSGIRTHAAGAEVTAPPKRDVSDVRELALVAMDAALEKKALAPVLIDVSAMASYTDFVGIVSGRSDRQVDAISDGICQAMKARGRQVLGQEGSGSGRWTLLDFGSFVIHVFHHPVREFYDLESLWIDAPRVKMDVPPESMLQQPDALYGAL